jgi:N-acetylneuraminate lyase
MFQRLLQVWFCIIHSTVAIDPLRVDGLVTAVVTPFSANGSVALDRIPEVSQHLTKTGVDYVRVFVGGTTGESLSLTVTERLALTEAWSRMPQKMIVHVGAEALGDAKTLVRHARAHGAKAVGCMPPVFFKPASVSILAKWLQAVAAEAPDLPLYYYHIPSMTGVNFLMLDLVKEVDAIGIPNFAGVKYTGLYETRAFPDLQQCMAYSDGKYEVFCGREEMMVEALSVGVKGFIGSQPNVVGDLYNAILKAWPHGPHLKLQMHALRFLDLQLAAPTGVNALKLALEFAGVEMGPARLPSIDADARTNQDYFGKLKQWCSDGFQNLNLTLEMCTHNLHSGIAMV